MLKGSENIPCPMAGLFSPLNYSNQVFASENTEDVDFDSDIQAHFRQTAPRRRKTLRHSLKEITIHQDSARLDAIHGTTIQDCNATKLAEIPDPTLAGRCSHREMRAKCVPSAKPKVGIVSEEETAHHKRELCNMQLRKEPRRRTIYIPSDHTSILTIHPGWPTQGALRYIGYRGSATEGRSKFENDPLENSRANSPARVRRPALQPALVTVQELLTSCDRPGAGPGKENLAPAYAARLGKNKILSGHPRSSKQTLLNQTKEPRLFRGTISNQSIHRTKSQPCRCTSKALDFLPDGSLADTAESTIGNRVHPRRRSDEIKQIPQTIHKIKSQARRLKASLSTASGVPKCHFQLLTESLHSTVMYEINWLDNQESAITQLVNHLINTANKHRESEYESLSYAEVRQRLLDFYQLPSTVIVYKKLQASLQYGSLRSPSSSQQPLRIQKDVGFRKRFIRLWTHTFDLRMLKVALEVVSGRQVHSSDRSIPARWSEQGRQELKLSITKFIDLCVVGASHGDLQLSRAS